MWTCPKCGAKFVSTNMPHSCGRYRLEPLFARSDPHVIRLYEKLRRMVERCGPAIMIPQKTRLVFMVRMRFVNVTVHKAWLRVGLILERRLPPDPRLVAVETFGPRCHAHYFRIESPSQLDPTMQTWIGEAYESGAQAHFERRGRAARRTSNRRRAPFVR